MIKLLEPDMPTADELLSYLRRIDASKIYTNHGPLVQELETRLEKMIGPCVVVSTGTAALELALWAVRRNMDWSNTYVPSVTFVATGLAALPSIDVVDVDIKTCQLSPGQLLRDKYNIAVPVAAFGSPVKLSAWETFATETSSHVVIDAAGAFGQQEISKHPLITTCFSLHATKIVGAGEGGIVCSSDPKLLDQIRESRCFGLETQDWGSNAKLSEYHAAVALASLDILSGSKDRIEFNRRTYLLEFTSNELLSHFTGDPIFGSTMLNVMLDQDAEPVAKRLAERGIQTKQWYRPFLHEHDLFRHHRVGTFYNSQRIADRMLGLPFHNFLTPEDIQHVCRSLKECLS